MAFAGERQRESVDDLPRDVVLHPEQIAERRLHRVRGEQRPARRLDELRRRAQLVARAKQRAHDHAIDVGFDGQRLDVGRLRRQTVRRSRSIERPAIRSRRERS